MFGKEQKLEDETGCYGLFYQYRDKGDVKWSSVSSFSTHVIVLLWEKYLPLNIYKKGKESHPFAYEHFFSLARGKIRC